MTLATEQVTVADQARRSPVKCAVLACLLLLGIVACEREAGQLNIAPSTAAPNARGPWKEGIHYARIDPRQDVSTPSGKIEVVEVFWYGCSTCYVFEPRLVLWERNKPEYIELIRLPAVFGPTYRAHARLYYALKAVGREDLHQTVYDTIHRVGSPLLASTDAETFKQQLEFATTHGIGEDEFTKAYDSAAVTAAVERAERLAKAYRIERTPTLTVQGSYQTDIPRAGGEDYIFGVVQHLVARELRGE